LPAAPDEASRDDDTGDGADDVLELGADPAIAARATAVDGGGAQPHDVFASAARGSGADAAPVPARTDAPMAVTAADSPDEGGEDSADDAAAGVDEDDGGGAGRDAPRAADHDAADAQPGADDDGAARGA
jgi:hypothetical protein